MIHLKDQIRDVFSGEIFEVQGLGIGYITVVNPNNERSSKVISTDGATGEFLHRNEYAVSSCPHAVTERPHTPYTSQLIEYLAYNNGVMESRLEDMWLTLDRINSRLVADSMFGLQQDVARLLGGIQTTAESLHPFPQPDGSARTSRLFDMIYADRK